MKQKNIIVTTTITIILIIVITINFVSQKMYKLEPFKEKNGWGYSIYEGKKLIIKQENIPAIQVKKPFAFKKDAIKIGELMIYKLKNGKWPTITNQDLITNKVNL